MLFNCFYFKLKNLKLLPLLQFATHEIMQFFLFLSLFLFFLFFPPFLFYSELPHRVREVYLMKSPPIVTCLKKHPMLNI